MEIEAHSPTYYNIEKAFGRLLDQWPGHSRLFFYWSGHGFVEKTGDRIFACQDYQSDKATAWVFNARHRLARLHSSQFKSFSQQIFLADVCGQYTNLKFGRDEQPYDDRLKTICQIAFFATPEGEYAKGAFTEVVIEVLKQISGWPDVSAFSSILKDTLKTADVQPFIYGGWDEEQELADVRAW